MGFILNKIKIKTLREEQQSVTASQKVSFLEDRNQTTFPPFGHLYQQDIIKVRERIPHIGPLTKVSPLKLFLQIVPSSSEDTTRAMRGQPK